MFFARISFGIALGLHYFAKKSEDRRRLGNANKSKLSFGIALGLHYLCPQTEPFEMKLHPFFMIIGILCFVIFPLRGEDFSETPFNHTDTVKITGRGHYYYFSKDVWGVPHVHFMGKGMRCVEPLHFSDNGAEVSSETILSNLYGVHEIPQNRSTTFRINDVICSYPYFSLPDTSKTHADAVIFDSYFEDTEIAVDNSKETLTVSHVINFIPEGYAKYDVIHIKNQPYIVAKANINGKLYMEWFTYNTCNQKPLRKAGKYAARGIETGVLQAARGIETGMTHAAKGMEAGGQHAVRSVEIGVQKAVFSAEIGARGAETGVEGATTGIGRAVYNESMMFYRPSRVMEDMSPLVFEEKSIEVEKGVTIYTYHFKCENPKANIFLIHGNGGNVSTYKNMIQTLVEGNYNVYTVDWRGYGKSTGKPEYKGVLKDTETAFDDFRSLTRHDSLKTIVYGMSLGGQMATKLVRDRQQDVDALILDGSLSSAHNLAMDFAPSKFIRDNMEKNASMFNQEYVAEREIQEITNIPKLIIHSKTDDVVAFYHGERLYENAPPPKTFWKTVTRHIRTLEELAEETIAKIDRLLQ